MLNVPSGYQLSAQQLVQVSVSQSHLRVQQLAAQAVPVDAGLMQSGLLCTPVRVQIP